MSNSKQLHGGHRSRLYEKFISFGPDVFTDHELLEILLFFSIPRANTNDTAHKLIDKFGSLNGVFTAELDQLLTVEGVGKHSAINIALVGSILARLKRKPVQKRRKFNDLTEVGEMLTEYYQGIGSERFCALYFDASMRLLDMTVIAEGTVGKVSVTPSKIAREAVLKSASGVILAHNHPLGAASLSVSDRNVTHIVEASLAAVDVPLIEHIVVGEVGYAPTMMYKVSTVRSSLFTSVYGDTFYKTFYNVK